MLRKETLYYYKNGYNCSQCLLKAAEQIYKIPISKQVMKMCSNVNTGFGIDSICSVLVSAIMLFGLMFDEEIAKKLRIKLLSEFQSSHASLVCGKLKALRDSSGGCTEVIGAVADITERLINEEIR